MTTTTTPTEIADDLFCIDSHMFGEPENLAAYVYRGDVPTLIEPGPGTSHDHVAAGLRALGVDELAQIVCTHIHLDHAGGAGLLAAQHPAATVVVHTVGARHLADPSKLLASATRIYGEEKMATLWGPMPPIAADRIRAVDEGDIVDLGAAGSLDVWYTPGHAKHHVSLHDRDRGLIFTGDTAGMSYPGFSMGHPIVPPPDIDVQSLHAQYARYRAAEPSALCLAHYGRRDDWDTLLDDVERRLDLWTSVVAARLATEPDADPGEIGRELAAANRADLEANGHPAEQIDVMQRRTNFVTEATGLRRALTS